jgi:hypothetical protein
MHTLALEHGETPWTAALIPLSVDGMIIASSMSLLLDSRRGIRSGALPWLLLLIGSSASLAANVAVAEPTPYGRIIAASGPAAARDILTAYAGLPLAIRIAAGRLAADPQWPLRHLAAVLSDEGRRLDALSGGDRAVRASIARTADKLAPSQHRVHAVEPGRHRRARHLRHGGPVRHRRDDGRPK